MLKNRLKELSLKKDNSEKIEIIKDSGLSLIKGGKIQPTCSRLASCSCNGGNEPPIGDCAWNVD
jgi:hypothetical protein